MSQVACLFVQEDDSVDYTPDGADVAAGQVVVLGSRQITIAKKIILDGDLGALATEGVFDVPKVTGAITGGEELYWDDDADPVGGDAGSGAFTTDSSLGPFAGFASQAGAASGDAAVRMLLCSSNLASATPRSSLGQDTGKAYNLPLTRLTATGTGAALGTAAGTPSGALGLTVGTFGSASPKVVGEAANNNHKTDYARFQFALPAEYVSGGGITVRVKSRITGNVQVAQTIDCSVYKTDGAAGIGSDLCSTSAITLTTSFANHDFTITPSGLVAGDLLDVQLTADADDTGGSANKLIEIGAVELLLDVKG